MKKTLFAILALVIAVGVFSAVGVIAYANETEFSPPVMENSKELPEADYEIRDYRNLSDEAREAYRILKGAEKMSNASDNFEEVLAELDADAEQENSAIRTIFEFRVFENTETYTKLMELDEEERFVTISFRCTPKPEQLVMCLEYVDGEWITLRTDRYTVGNGICSIKARPYDIIAAVFLPFHETTPSEMGAFVPSVERMGIPEGAGNLVIRRYIDEKGPQDIVWVIPDDEYEFYQSSELMGELMDAYNSLASAEKISDVCDNFTETIAALDPALSEDNAVIRDVFEFRLGKGSASIIKLLENKEEERRFVDLPFSYKTDEGQYLVVLEYVDEKWVALDELHCVYDGNTASVRVEYDGLIAICVISK